MDDLSQQLAAAMDDHQVTDESGAILEESTSTDNSAESEQKTTEQSTEQAVKPTDAEAKAPQADVNAEETQLAEDEAGKRYVPEERFNKIYGKSKAAERKLKEMEAELIKLKAPQGQYVPPTAPLKPVDRTEAIEVELLKGKMPEFDPESERYSPEIDALGGEIFKANPGITRIEAARKAMNYAKNLNSKIADAQNEARAVKSSQADHGITNRVVSRTPSTDVPGENATLEEQEAYLRRTGQW